MLRMYPKQALMFVYKISIMCLCCTPTTHITTCLMELSLFECNTCARIQTLEIRKGKLPFKVIYSYSMDRWMDVKSVSDKEKR